MHDFLVFPLNGMTDRRSNSHVMVYFETLLKYLPVHYCSMPMNFGNLSEEIEISMIVSNLE